MKYITVIPARGGSKRFPMKNIYPLNGIPLIAYSIEYSKQNSIDDVYVSTDSQEILDVAIQYGAKVLSRSTELSGDYVTTAAVLKNVAEQLLSQGVEYDYMVLLQVTNPLRPSNMIKEAKSILEKGVYDSLITVNRSDRKLGKIVDNQFVPWNYTFGQRSQDLEPLYYENGLLYISSKELILQGKILGYNMYPLIVDHIYGDVDIDTVQDLKYAEYILSQKCYETPLIVSRTRV